MTVEQDAGNLLLFFYDELIKKEKGTVDAQDVVDNIKLNSSRINIAFNYLKSNGCMEEVRPYIGNTKGVQNFRLRELSYRGIRQVEELKRFEETFGFEENLISISTNGSQHKKQGLNIEKQEAKRDIINVARDYKQGVYEAEQEAKDREFHTLNLRTMVQTWQRLLPEIPPTEETKNTGRSDGFDIAFIKNIEEHILFKDLFHHYPAFEDAWNNFKKGSSDYSSKKQTLFNSIKEDVQQKFENQNINIKSIESGFQVSVYREVVIKDTKKKYDYFWERESINDVILTHLKYCEKADRDSFIKSDSNSFLIWTCHALASTKEPEIVQKIHNELIKECKERYIKQSDELIKEEGNLRESKDDLYHNLETIFQKPFPQMDCEFVKGFKSQL